MSHSQQSVAAILAFLAASCSQSEPESETATLYRNGSLIPNMRIHFASFDAEGEANDFNINNCQMAARILNANVMAQSSSDVPQSVGFWCEPGLFRMDGMAPTTFDAEFPTDVSGTPAP